MLSPTTTSSLIRCLSRALFFSYLFIVVDEGVVGRDRRWQGRPRRDGRYAVARAAVVIQGRRRGKGGDSLSTRWAWSGCIRQVASSAATIVHGLGSGHGCHVNGRG